MEISIAWWLILLIAAMVIWRDPLWNLLISRKFDDDE
jgi:hypothetical protein